MTASRSSPALAVALVIGAASLAMPGRSDAAITLNFAALPGAEIVFNPADPAPGFTGSFSFVNTSTTGPHVFEITSGSGSQYVGDSVSLEGNITGTYNIGTITTVGSIQTAPVTNGAGTHKFTIFDGAHTFTADVAWIDISTLGTIGGLNGAGSINLINISYSGTVADLVALAQNPTGTSVVTFQFSAPTNLTQLTTSGGRTSFSGSVTQSDPAPVVPEPGTVALLASAVPVLLVARLVRRRNASLADAA